MWAAMSTSPPIVPGATDSNNHYSRHSSNGDSSSQHVYVHHINEQQAPQQQYAPPPQPQPVFMPMPYSQPQPMPMFMGGMGGGCAFHPQPQPQPPVIVVNGKSGDRRGGGDEETGNGDERTDDDNDDNSSGFSSILLVSIIFVFIGSVLGSICVRKVYDVFENSMESDYVSDYFVVNRQVALGIGAFATLCYCIAFMLAFYAGMKYKLKCKENEKKCCRDGLLIAAWVIFCLTSINNLIILILAFDEEARIYPEVALCAVLGSIVAWLFVFGWAEMTRRSG